MAVVIANLTFHHSGTGHENQAKCGKVILRSWEVNTVDAVHLSRCLSALQMSVVALSKPPFFKNR